MSSYALALLAVAFAFPNEGGTRLLTTASLDAPAAYHTALCTGGRRAMVEFDHNQGERPASNGRQTPQNFDNIAGTVFRVVGPAVAPGATCAIADGAFVAGAVSVPVRRSTQDSRCSNALYSHFQSDKNRPVVACWPIAASDQGVHIAVIEFARRLSSALASLVVIDGERRLYIDFPAEFRGPGADLWRADDGGEIHPEGFEVVFLLKRGDAYVLGIDWKGAEGSALSIWGAEPGTQFKEVLTDFWYRSPL